MNSAREVALTLLATLALAGCGEHVPTEVACKLPSGEIVSGPSVFEQMENFIGEARAALAGGTNDD